MQRALAATLANPKDWSDAKLSPVTIKTDYFEESLVKTVGRCLPTARDVAVTSPMHRDHASGADIWRVGKMGHPTTGFFSESGVRELSYDIDPELSFLDLSRAKRSTTWPFAFILQVTFESRRFFSNDRDSGFDEKPFEYPAIQPWIDKRVAEGAASRSAMFDAPRTIKDLREFAVLQRLFRLALDGKIGTRFPHETLVSLNRVKPRTPQLPIVPQYGIAQRTRRLGSKPTDWTRSRSHSD